MMREEAAYSIRAGLREASTGFGGDLPYGRQSIDEDDINAVLQVLRSERLTQGPLVGEFEESFAAYVGARYAVAVSSGTAALHLACLAAGLGPGDQVITSPISFAASANCALYVGASPAFVDIEAQSFNMNPERLEAYLQKGAPRPRAVIPVHFAGLPCDMERIHRIARRFGLLVIEDACHALGARYMVCGQGGRRQWIKVGSSAHSNMSVFSFHPVKHITTAEGGMITTNDKRLYERLVLLRNHGITRDRESFKAAERGNVPSWYYEIQELGYNYRLSDLQCALGLSQLKKLEMFVDRRRKIARAYTEVLGRLPELSIQHEPQDRRSSYHLYTVRLKHTDQGGRDRLMEALRLKGIGTQVHYIPIYRHPFYRRMGFSPDSFPQAEAFFRGCLSIPIFPAMDSGQVAYVLDALQEALRRL